MIRTLAIANYRSLRQLIVPLGPLNLIQGPNASGKSNLYRALRLLAETAQGGVVASLAREGGLASTLWAGPETISRGMRSREVPVQGGPRQNRVSLRLGFGGDELSDLRSFGLALAQRGGKNGKKRAVVAVARKVAVVLHRLWVSGEDYQAHRRPAAA